MEDYLTYNEAIKVVITSFLPYLELRGAIPLALFYGARPWEAFVLGVTGNLLPIIPIMLVLPIIAEWGERSYFFRHLLTWINRRTEQQQKKVNKIGFVGLMLFVAIPLPMTGVWTGATVAYLLGIRKRYAFFALMLGTILAGIIVTLMTTGVLQLFK